MTVSGPCTFPTKLTTGFSTDYNGDWTKPIQYEKLFTVKAVLPLPLPGQPCFLWTGKAQFLFRPSQSPAGREIFINFRKLKYYIVTGLPLHT